MPDSSSFDGHVPVHVALALLASLRDVDTPTDPEAFGETEMPLNLQRRLGLSRVVVDQIRRYEQRRGGAVSATEVASLFELIGRRSDAAAIFHEAGRRIAREDLKGRRLGARLGARVLPSALRRRRAWHRVRRLARRVSPDAAVRLERKPSSLVIEGSLPARAAEGGAGCSVLDGMIDQVFEAYRTGEKTILHRRCEGRSGDCCAWELSVPDATNGGRSGARMEGNGAAPGRGVDPPGVSGEAAEAAQPESAPGG